MRARRLVLAAGLLLALGLTVLVGVDSMRNPQPGLNPHGPRPASPPEPPPVDLTIFTEVPAPPPAESGRSPATAPARRERLGGRVVTTDGRSLSDVTVVCVRREGDGGTHRVTGTTDAHGRWELDVPPGGPWHVQVTGSLPGGVPVIRESSGTLRAGEVDRDLTVEAADAFSGHVLAPDGRTVAGATVEIWSSKRRGSGPHFRLTTDAAGEFKLLLPAGGTARIKAYVPTTEDVGLPYCRAFASDVKPNEPVDLALRPGEEIRGRITWREGGPAGRLPLRAHQKLGSHPMVVRALTNEWGEFRIGGLFSTMDYRLEIDRDRHEGRPLDLVGDTWARSGSRDVSLQVSTAILVTGALYRPSGEPARNWSFWLIHEGSQRKVACRTRRDGTFVLRAPESGRYTAWSYYIVDGKRHRLTCGTFRSGDSGVVLQIPHP